MTGAYHVRRRMPSGTIVLSIATTREDAIREAAHLRASGVDALVVFEPHPVIPGEWCKSASDPVFPSHQFS